MRLTYRGLTVQQAQTLIGRPLGCGPNAEPLQVIGVEPAPDGGALIELEEWTPPPVGQPTADPVFPAAAQYAQAVWLGRHNPPTC